jgi:phosphoribosylformimino-5-aminoimidazole carboxamide ribotide isomerase
VLVVPAIDVLRGSVVRLVEGDYHQVTDYGGQAVEWGRHWTGEGAELLHVVDLEGARSGVPDPALWRTLAEASLPFQVGGGIRSPDVALEALTAGAQRVVLGTAAVWAPATVASLLSEVGPDRVVAALDVRDGRAAGSGWRDQGRDLADVVGALSPLGLGRVLLTSIGRDGTMTGPDLGLLDEVRLLAGELRVIASGGVGSLDDIRALAAAGAEAVVVGRALYEGRFTLGEAITAAN